VIKRLLSCVREYKKASLLTMLFTILEVVVDSLIPYIMADLIDKGFTDGNMKVIILVGAELLGMSAVALLFGILSSRVGSRSSNGFAKNLRKEMYQNVQTFSFSNIDKFSTSSIITRLTSDVQRVSGIYMMVLRMALRMPIMMIFSVLMTTFISWKLAIIFLIAAPVLGAGMLYFSQVVHPIFHRAFKRYDVLNKNVQEDLHGIRVVKSFVREDFEKQRFNGTSKEIYDDFVKAEKIISWNDPYMTFIMNACSLIVSFLGAKWIVSGERLTVTIMGDVFTTGLLSSVFSYSMQILMACMMVGMIFMQYTMARESINRIVAILDEKADIADPENPVMEVADGSIDFDHVEFQYKSVNQENSIYSDKPSLSDVDIHIPSGATVGIIGGTGSSKSTFVQMIPRLYDATKGSVKVGGVDVRDYNLKVLRDSVAMVLQKNQLFFGSIADNMRWGNEHATDEEIRRACKLAQIDDFIQELPDKYDYHIDQGGTNVSGGQRQRLCIARALVKKPKILILDDSTSAVDTATDAKIRNALAHEIPNTTKLIIAQRISSVQEADMIIVLDEGRVNGVGTHSELLKNNAIYREVYYAQQKGGAPDEE